MRWFDGGIPEAIQEAKNNKSVFIVFISAEDDKSEEMESHLHRADVTELCERSRCIAIRMVSNSNECKFFSQIFPVVVIPSTFFIGDNGTPLEVIGESLSATDYLSRVQAAITLQTESSRTEQQASHTEQKAQQAQQAQQAPQAEGAVGGGEEEEEVDDTVSPEKKAKTELRKEDKVERAKELLEEKREEKAQKAAEETKRKELERRTVGQGVQKLRQSQQETELLEARKELRKDRDDDKLARQRVKEQIARDRAERNARLNEAREDREKTKEEEEERKRKLMEQQVQAQVDQSRRSEFSRLQFRLPDGSSITNQFAATDTFRTVHAFITGHTGHGVSLSTSFPRRTFTEADHTQTLQALGLAPSALLLVLPGRGGGSRPGLASAGGGGAVGLSSILFAPFVFLWNLLASLLGLSSPAPAPTPSPTPKMSGTATDTATGGDGSPGSARQRGPSSRTDGAIRRFHNTEDDEDDEDRATWNGNSTQQM